MAAALVGMSCAVLAAQMQDPFSGSGRRGGPAVDAPGAPMAYDGRVAFVRLRYGGSQSRGFRREPPWAHDYPRADRHIMRILSEVTSVRPHIDETQVFTLDNPALHAYPIAYMAEPGFWQLSNAEVEGLRAYFAKGGFVIFDDFRGDHVENLRAQLRQVLPAGQLVPLDPAHPIFHSFFELDPRTFVPPYGNLPPAFLGIFEDNDPARRLLLVANDNNDLGEYWEFSDTGWMPVDLSNDAYKFGVNYIIYGLTH